MEKDEQHYFYTGEKILLRGIRREDYTKGMYRWANNPEFNRYLSYGLRPSTKDAMEKLYEDLSNKENFIFTIIDKETEKTVGIVGLHQPNWQIRSVEYSIHIGEKEALGKGLSSEATDFILKYAFETLNLYKVWLGVNEANKKAIHFYEKKGFVHEGILRAEIFRNNRYFGSMRMSMLKEEYDIIRLE